MDKLRIHKIFETPIYIYEEPEFLYVDKLCNKYITEGRKLNKQLIKNREKHYKSKIGDFGLSHASHSLLNDNSFKDFGKFVGQTSYNLLESQGYNLKDYRVDFTEMWVQEFAAKGGGHQRVHVHQNSHLSGFYFLKASEKTSYPMFHDPRPGAMMTKLPLKENFTSLSMINADIKPKPGMFIFFNSYLPHEFIVDPGIQPFRFIHFNLVALPNKYFQDELSKK